MKIVEEEGFCTCCGKYCSYNYGDENYSLIKKDLNNYKKYKDIYVYDCPNCGFISTDIAGEDGILMSEDKDTYEYRQLISYAYLQGLDKELYESHSNDIPANYYEAYAYSLQKLQMYEKCIRTLNKCIELKTIMKNKYRLSQDELGGEEENDDEYEKLYALIDESIDVNCRQIDYMYNLVDIKNVYLNLLYVENLIRMDSKVKAVETFNQIIKKNNIQDDLKKYFISLLDK